MDITAEVIADSVTPEGHRVTTIEATYPRFVHAELMTHRVFSRNSASSRAIPLVKQLERVGNNPVYPIVWPSEKPGMQGGAEIEEREQAAEIWTDAMMSALTCAASLGELGVHKSIPNRLIEPFAPHTVVITSTAWGNFAGLRTDIAAEPHIRAAADAMMAVYAASAPKTKFAGEWHLPYIGEQEVEQAEKWLLDTTGKVGSTFVTKALVMMSSARCAAVSYMKHGDWRDVEKDVGLYDKLVTSWPMHASPLEHVCTPDPTNVHTVAVQDVFRPADSTVLTLTLPRYGNLLGWHQHRFDAEVRMKYQAFA